MSRNKQYGPVHKRGIPPNKLEEIREAAAKHERRRNRVIPSDPVKAELYRMHAEVKTLLPNNEARSLLGTIGAYMGMSGVSKEKMADLRARFSKLVHRREKPTAVQMQDRHLDAITGR